MAVTYYVGFSIAESHPGFSLAITRSIYNYTVTAANLESSYYTALADGDGYVSFAGALQTAIIALATTAGDPQAASWLVTWTHSAMVYTIDHAAGAFTATLSTDAQRVLGMAASLGSATFHDSTVRPYYVIRPSTQSFKMTRPPYESGDGPDEEETDDGRAKGIGRTAYGVDVDLTQLYEPVAACESLSATAAVPWTWRHAFRHARTTHPIVLVTAATTQNTITYVAADVWARLQLRKAGALWRSEYAIAKPSVIDTHRHIPLLCRVLEQLAT